jgi:hypothetical protein
MWRVKGNSATRPPDKCQTLLGLARRRAAVTLDGVARFPFGSCLSGISAATARIISGSHSVVPADRDSLTRLVKDPRAI